MQLFNQKITRQKKFILALVIAGILACTSIALAEKPSWAGGKDKGGNHEQKQNRDDNQDRDDGDAQNRHGDDRHGTAFFGDLHRDVIFHDLTPEVLVQLGPPPAKHRFVRVASDILLIAIGTGMIVDAVQDLNEI